MIIVSILITFNTKIKTLQTIKRSSLQCLNENFYNFTERLLEWFVDEELKLPLTFYSLLIYSRFQ